MTVIEIVKAYLTEHGHDGLCNPEAECGCGIGGLAPCGEMGERCEPARLDEEADFYVRARETP
jgi:hypothetical protein